MGRLLRIGLIAVSAGLLHAAPARGQVSKDEHEKHHPAQGQVKKAGGGEHGGMMAHGGTPQAKELYPSLMNLSDLSPERRDEVQRQAHERMKGGTALMSQGLEK